MVLSGLFSIMLNVPEDIYVFYGIDIHGTQLINEVEMICGFKSEHVGYQYKMLLLLN